MTTLDLREGAAANQINAADGEARQVSKRRSIRVEIDFPVSVFGQNSNGKIFAENARTLAVSAHGALVILETDIDSQKPALLVNTKTGAEVQCRIVYRKEIPKDRFKIGLEFVNPYPRFWGMNFPPEDWDPTYRKKATSPRGPVSRSTKGPR